MASPTDRGSSLPPSKKPPGDAIATPEDPDAPSPQLASTCEGSRPISTSRYLNIKKVNADPATEEEYRRRDQGLYGVSSNDFHGTILPKRLFAPSENSRGLEVSHTCTRLESSPEEDAESHDTIAGEQGEAHIDKYTEKSPLLPSSVDSKGRVTCKVDCCPDEDGNWVIENKECGDRLSSAEYLRQAKARHVRIQRDMEIARWAKKSRPETGTLQMNEFSFIVKGPNDIKRDILRRESMIGSRPKRRKK